MSGESNDDDDNSDGGGGKLSDSNDSITAGVSELLVICTET